MPVVCEAVADEAPELVDAAEAPVEFVWADTVPKQNISAHTAPRRIFFILFPMLQYQNQSHRKPK